MAKEMGLDRAPIEFQTFYFSHVLLVPPIAPLQVVEVWGKRQSPCLMIMMIFLGIIQKKGGVGGNLEVNTLLFELWKILKRQGAFSFFFLGKIPVTVSFMGDWNGVSQGFER